MLILPRSLRTLLRKDDAEVDGRFVGDFPDQPRLISRRGFLYGLLAAPLMPAVSISTVIWAKAAIDASEMTAAPAAVPW